MKDLPSIDSIARNAADLAPAGHEITAGYIGNLEWAPRRDDRSWRFFKSDGSKCESWPYGGKDTEAELADFVMTHPVQFAEWVQAPVRH